jgi:hypothetical protein
MRAQKSLSNDQCPCVKQGRVDPPQRFSGFTEGNNKIMVDLESYITMMTPDGIALPPLNCRMVPGQVDDILVSAPDKDVLGWQRGDVAFLLENVGVSVQRDTPSPKHLCDRDLKPCPYITSRRALIIPPGESVLIDVDVISCQTALEGWFEPCPDSLSWGVCKYQRVPLN